MIIIGYPGIGKSTLAKMDPKYIDLESSHFNTDTGRPVGWERIYCSIARDLSSQGHIVFVSCHEAVRRYLEESDAEVYLIYPARCMRSRWLDKLSKRANKTKSDKDKAAYSRAYSHYDNDISELAKSNIYWKIALMDMEYDLKAIIEEGIVRGEVAWWESLRQCPDEHIVLNTGMRDE